MGYRKKPSDDVEQKMIKYLLILSLLFVGCTKNASISYENLYALSLESCKYGYIKSAVDLAEAGVLIPDSDMNLSAYVNIEIAEKVCKEMTDKAVTRK